MLRDRGYRGSARNLRRVVTRLRPQQHEAFLRLQVFAGEQAQVDWASFGTVTLLDRLLHHAEVTVIEGSSYRVRESEQETTARRRRKK
jgi:transposase